MPQCQPEEAERPHDRSQPPDHGRLSFWSVTPGEQALYFGLFTLLATLGLGFAFWYEIAVNTSDTPFETVEAIIRGAAAVGVAAAGLTLVAAICSYKSTLIFVNLPNCRRRSRICACSCRRSLKMFLESFNLLLGQLNISLPNARCAQKGPSI